MQGHAQHVLASQSSYTLETSVVGGEGVTELLCCSIWQEGVKTCRCLAGIPPFPQEQ